MCLETRDRKNHDSQTCDRILCFCLCPEIGQYFPHFGLISLLNCTENPKKHEESPLEKIQKNPVETAPRNCRFLSLVMVVCVCVS